jgi:hypothetical protein
VTTTNGRRHRLTRVLAGAGAAWGVALLARPRRVVAALCPEFPASRLWLVRVLGARLVAQHAVVLLAPEAPVVRVASAVDLAHAASMVPLLASARYRRAALISGGVAAVYAATAPALSTGDRER